MKPIFEIHKVSSAISSQ